MATTKYRTEKDTMGEVRVPYNALYGAQTQRAVENYPVSGLREHPAMVRAYLLVKKAAALANFEHGELEAEIAEAICNACDELSGEGRMPFAKIAAGKGARRRAETSLDEDDVRSVPFRVPSPYIAEQYRDQFVVDVFQAGAGTSFNMNCNEVIATLASRALAARGDKRLVHPNDHVNMAQSTNDTFPTAMRIATLFLLRELFPVLDGLAFALDGRGDAFADVIKSGRTHLQDAVPVTLGQEFRAWSAALRRATRLLLDASDELRELGIGGTAAGTGINTPRGFRYSIVRYLHELTELNLSSAEDLREVMQSQLAMGAVSSALKNLALELTRITNDLRLLASGPLTGLAEITLPSVQPGSSIMPGKVNPSMLECMNQICFHVIGSDSTISFALQAGQLELNVMMPLMAYELLFSLEILKNYMPVFTQKCINGIQAEREQCEKYYVTSPSLATALNPLIGYERAAQIAKESAATRTPIPQLLREKGLLSEEQIAALFSPDSLTGQADYVADEV